MAMIYCENWRSYPNKAACWETWGKTDVDPNAYDIDNVTGELVAVNAHDYQMVAPHLRFPREAGVLRVSFEYLYLNNGYDILLNAGPGNFDRSYKRGKAALEIQNDSGRLFARYRMFDSADINDGTSQEVVSTPSATVLVDGQRYWVQIEVDNRLQQGRTRVIVNGVVHVDFSYDRDTLYGGVRIPTIDWGWISFAPKTGRMKDLVVWDDLDGGLDEFPLATYPAVESSMVEDPDMGSSPYQDGTYRVVDHDNPQTFGFGDIPGSGAILGAMAVIRSGAAADGYSGTSITVDIAGQETQIAIPSGADFSSKTVFIDNLNSVSAVNSATVSLRRG